MRDPDWAKLLSLLYEKESGYALPLDENNKINTNILDDYSISDELDLADEEIGDSTEFLQDANMIFMDHFDDPNVNDPRQNEIYLTRLGFEVAHDRSQADHRRHLDTLVGVFTLLLAMGSFTQALVAIVQLESFIMAMVISVSVSGITLMGAYALFKFLGLHPILDFREWVAGR